MSKFKFLNKMLKGSKGRFLVAVFVIISYTTLMLVSPLLFRFLVDNVIDQLPLTNQWLITISNLFGGVAGIRSNLWIGAFLIILVNLVAGILYFFRGRLNALIAETVTKNIRDTLYSHLIYLPYEYHVKSKSGDLIQRCTSDVDQVRRVFAGQIAELIYALTLTSIALTILFGLNTQLALIATISMPIIFFFAFIFFKKMQKAFLASDESEGEMSNVIQENLSGMRVVKAFNQEAYEMKNFAVKNQDFHDKTLKMMKLLGMYWGISDFICMAQILVVVIFGIKFANQGLITVGDFFVFLSYESMILWPIRHVGRILSDLGKVSVSLGRLLEILDYPIEDIFSGKKPLIKGEIEFKDVYFNYDEDPDILKGLSFKIKAGQTVAFLGPTGSGKSTIAHLLCRLYDYKAGEIYLDQVALKDIAKGYLRENLGIVLQEPFLYSRSIYENIETVKSGASMRDVERAAKIANIDHVIKGFDLGYKTLVGEKGVTLSGGQKQRVAIARTVINETPVLIFDDSLSAVDTETDAAIRDALRSRSQDVTTIIITQRVSASESADQIFIIDEGKIVQTGTHQELIEEAGLYQRIYQLQSQQSEIEEAYAK